MREKRTQHAILLCHYASGILENGGNDNYQIRGGEKELE